MTADGTKEKIREVETACTRPRIAFSNSGPCYGRKSGRGRFLKFTISNTMLIEANERGGV